MNRTVGKSHDKKETTDLNNHNTKTGIVTIAYHRLSDEVPKGTQDQKEEAKYTELFEWTSIEDKSEKKKIN